MKKIGYLASIGLATCVVQNASAQTPPAGLTNYLWTAAGDGTTWSQGANWRSINSDAANFTGTAPVNDGTTFQIYIGTGFPTTTPTPIVIGPSDNVILSDQVFGPEWGETLNIYGTVTAGYGFCPLGAVGGPKSTVNMYGTSFYNSSDSIFVGDPWWFGGGPNVDINLRDSATISTRYLAEGGHLNLYGGMAVVTNALFVGTDGAGQFGGVSSDATRYINVVNGKIEWTGDQTVAFNNMITRGILFAYGKKYSTNDIVIVYPDPNFGDPVNNPFTSLSAVPLGGARLNVHLGPVRSTMMAGTRQQILVEGDYPNVTNVVLSYLDPTTVSASTYSTTDTSVLTVDTNGMVTAVNIGTASVIANFETNSFTNSITVTPYTFGLIHRYSFSETSGTSAADSVGGPSWNGTLVNSPVLDGTQVRIDPALGNYVQLPAGVVSNLDAVTIEAWVSFGALSNYPFAAFYAFGDSNPDTGFGRDYIMMQPYTDIANMRISVSDADPGNLHEQSASVNVTNVISGATNIHVVAVYHPYAGYEALYTNGVQVARHNNIVIPLKQALGADPLNYIGRSLYQTDPMLDAWVNEFRIYNGALRQAEINATQLLGPNQLLGTATGVTLSAIPSGANIVISWPTNSALVNLVSSPTLGAGAAWTPVAGGLSLNAGSYQMTVPASSSAMYFRLQN